MPVPDFVTRPVAVRRSVAVERSARVMQLEGLFDLPPADRADAAFEAAVPSGPDWRIGLVIGPSGSGKTSLAREAWPDAPFVSVGEGYDWPTDRAVVDGFPPGLGVKDVTGLLSSVGFSSPPAWLRPFRCLSTGEQFRATVARALADPAPLVVLDEFTSVGDRTVARIGSAAVAKAVRRDPGKRVVCVTCHDDVEPWLCPDWVIRMPAGTLTRRSLRRPPVRLTVRRVHRSAWDLFKAHHYLSAAHDTRAWCFVASVFGRPAAFASAHHYPHPSQSWWKEHRLVCLPDFQGVGIGNALSAYVASLLRALGKPYRSVTGSPAVIRHRLASPLWRMYRPPGLAMTPPTGSHRTHAMLRKTMAFDRLTAGFEYAGPARPAAARALGLPVPP